MMHGRGESDSAIVAVKPTNASQRCAAESDAELTQMGRGARCVDRGLIRCPMQLRRRPRRPWTRRSRPSPRLLGRAPASSLLLASDGYSALPSRFGALPSRFVVAVGTSPRRLLGGRPTTASVAWSNLRDRVTIRWAAAMMRSALTEKLCCMTTAALLSLAGGSARISQPPTPTGSVGR